MPQAGTQMASSQPNDCFTSRLLCGQGSMDTTDMTHFLQCAPEVLGEVMVRKSIHQLRSFLWSQLSNNGDALAARAHEQQQTTCFDNLQACSAAMPMGRRYEYTDTAIPWVRTAKKTEGAAHQRPVMRLSWTRA